MNPNKLKKSIHQNIIALSIILLMTSLCPALAGAGTIQYTYDDTRQLKTSVYDDATKVEYAYDGSGNRITKTVSYLVSSSVLPSSLDFGSVIVGNTSPPQTVTVTNTGTGNLIIGAITITGTNASEFIKQADTCSSATIPASATCQIQITFSPISVGTKTAALSIPSNDPAAPVKDIPLSGTGNIGYVLSVTKGGASTGTVTSNPVGIDCGADCTEAYSPGTLVTLTAAPGNCATFAGWSGACTGGTCSITMNAYAAATAAFNFISPVAEFSASPLSGPAPLTVNFTDLSTCGTSWSWTFGDTTASTLQNPSHTYTPLFGNSLSVSHNVSLTASNSAGSNTLIKANYITVQCPDWPVRIIRAGATYGYYTTLQAAYNAAATGDTIQSHAVLFTGNLDINRDITITLEGGYGCDYSVYTSSPTILKGKLQTYPLGGKLTIKNFVLEK